MAGGKMHTPHPTLLDSPLAISYKNHQKNLAYFSHLIGTITFAHFYKKAESKGGDGHGTMPPLNTLLTALHLLYFVT